MWKYIKPALGVLLLVLFVLTLRYWIVGDKRPPGRDMEAIGAITHLEANRLKITRLATKTDYYLTYSFRAHDGERYSKHFTISPEEYASLRKGQKVRVLYHSNNPSINAVPALRHYNSVAELAEFDPDKHPVMRVGMLLAYLIGGVLLLWSSFGGSLSSVSVPKVNVMRRPQPTARIPSDRMASVRQGARPVSVRGR
ncbi:MAG: hypothetical protein R3D67_19905 [Hyphomicrobiaceae bacterium]